MPEPLTLLLIAAAFLIGGMVKGAIGLGLPVVVLALLVLVMPLREAMAIFVIPGFVSNLWQAQSGVWFRELLGRLWTFLLGSVFGIVTGVAIMAGTKSEIMVLVMGSLLVLYGAYALVGPRVPEPGRHEVWLSPLCGFLGGLLFGMAGLFIVPALIYLEALRIPRDKFIQALGITFLTITSTLGISMQRHGLLGLDLALISALGLVPVFIGIWLGRRVRHRISEAFYRKLFFIALIVTGIYQITKVLLIDGF